MLINCETDPKTRSRHGCQSSQSSNGIPHEENSLVADTEDKIVPNWEEEKNINKDFSDDGTTSFFWRAHRVSALVIFSTVLLYVALWDNGTYNSEYNIKRGIIAVIISFVVFGVTITPDGPFKRPHPALWRFTLVLSIVYELFLVFLLFQTVDDARQLMKHVDSSLGVPLPEKSYGGSCTIYDSDKPDDPWHNVWDKMDGFVAVHFFGWWIKTLIVRDWWLCMVTSVLFEFVEYTLEHQLPNFSECWWDHWLMDVAFCNSLGIFLGMKTAKYLSMKPYHWRGLWSIPTYRGKISRILKQFTPYIYTDFDWRPTQSLKRWISVLLIILCILICELNTFTLKFVLWIPPSHFLCLGRLIMFIFWGAVGLREAFQYLDDPKCKKFGAQAILVISIMITEILVALKFDWETFTKPLPPHIMKWLLFGAFCLTLWTLWHFYLQRLLHYAEQKLKKRNVKAEQKENNSKKVKNGNTNGKGDALLVVADKSKSRKKY